MKSTIKALLLIIVTIGAIVAVLIFAKTRVAPPSDVEMNDPYPDAIASACTKIDYTSDIYDKKQVHAMLKDKIERYYLEDRITDSEADTRHSDISKSYGNELIKYGYSLFKEPHWDKAELNEMLKMVDEMDEDVLINGQKAIPQQEYSKAVKNLHKIVDNYDLALNHSKNTRFKDIQDADEKVRKANDFKQDYYLQNNIDLVQALDEMPEKIAKNHYDYLNKQCDKLKKYSNYSSLYDYEITISDPIEKEIDNYKTSTYCSNKPSIDPVNDKFDKIYSEANRYFDELERQRLERQRQERNQQYIYDYIDGYYY